MRASERTAFRKQVTAIIESSMALAGWRCVPYPRRSMKLFAREGDVTPFFLLASIAGREWGGYVIEGGMGIIHRPFERQWAATAQDAGDDGLTTCLHSANLRDLIDLACLDPQQPIETQVYLWCEAAVAILQTLPMTHDELLLTYKEQRLLAGRPPNRLLLPMKNEKRAGFLQFLDR